ncbi:MAG: hypothetical protein U0514_03515 [Candidatus Andersenbacteria bacterium]
MPDFPNKGWWKLSAVASVALLCGSALVFVHRSYAQALPESERATAPGVDPAAPPDPAAALAAPAAAEAVPPATPTEQAPVALAPVTPEVEPTSPAVGSVATDKLIYPLNETIAISGVPAKSYVELYWLDNPDTAPAASNVFATLVGDDGAVTLEAATLFPGRFLLVSTTDPHHCSDYSLSECRATGSYLGERQILITGATTKFAT